MYEDTYFLNAEEALRVAKQQNRPSRYSLQICYYNGIKIESEYKNLIHLPIENLLTGLAEGIYRFPTNLNFVGLELSESIKSDILQSFIISIKQAKENRNKYNAHYLKSLRNSQLDFSESLRFYLPANFATQVMQNISKNIANALEKLGYAVLFDLNIGMTDPASLKAIFEFNPHVTININHMNNRILNNEVFNFVWFQDSLPIVTNEEPLNLRERDYLFALIPGIQNELKNVKEAHFCEIQDFCINTSIYKQYTNVKREKKIVFIGGSYLENYMPYVSSCGGTAKDTIDDKATNELIAEVTDIYVNDGVFSSEQHERLSEKYNKSIELIHNYVIPLVVRDITLLKLCKMNIDYDIEIYGWGWEKYEELKPYYKGVLEYGEEISKVYNSATYAIVSHPYYIIQQRTLESAASGCIPLVYDCRYRYDVNPPYYENGIDFFTNLNDLEKILNKTPKDKNLQPLVENHSYSAFIQKILKIIDTNK